MHRFRFLRPAPELEPYVRFYAQREVRLLDATAVHPVHARSAPLLEFNFGDRFKLICKDNLVEKVSPRVVIVGPQTRFNANLELTGSLVSLVVMFQPDGMFRLFPAPMQELTDRNEDGHAVLGPVISALHERLGECRSFEERARLINLFLLRRALNARGSAAVSDAASQILRRAGYGRIAAFAGCAGLSVRQFERKFVEQVGIPPKLYSRIVRFEAAVDRKARSSRTWSDVAQELGYFDQMHMIHDFDEFTGMAPAQSLSRFEDVFQEQFFEVRSGNSRSHAWGGLRMIL